MHIPAIKITFLLFTFQVSMLGIVFHEDLRIELFKKQLIEDKPKESL